MAIKIISLSGYIGSGKNLFCDVLRQAMSAKQSPYELGTTWYQKAHATKLKLIASILLNIPVHKFEDAEFKKIQLGPEWARPDGKLMTVREFLQELGTNALRYHLHRDVWVNGLWCDYRPVPTQLTHEYGHRILQDWQAQPEDPNWIITDTRFQNEMKAIKDRNGLAVRINRGPRTSDHESEVTIDQINNWDCIINNTGSLEQLHAKAKEFINHFNL